MVIISEFYKRLRDLCEERSMTVNELVKILDLSSGSPTAWKNGTVPRNATLIKIADYLGVTTDYLLGKENKKAPTVSGERSVSNDDIKFALFGGDGEITDEMYEEVRKFAAFVKQREADKK